ncbi:MAG: 16S rRNA (guanine(527)-N(7))-methyltransferase RsmG [Armatimonadetes bacterium]|nr:16S rRNA (guanine(527)-N(7))-methyltransferase RsmG [Armatimonadota bacterium]
MSTTDDRTHHDARLSEGCEALGLELTPEARDRFHLLRELLYQANAVVNLTRVPETDFVELHCLDSLLVCRAIDMRRVRTVMDLGCGAGFPGIPLKIMWPHLRVVLVDSTLKKLRFAEDACTKLGLSGIRTVHGRAEERIVELTYRSDLVVARAVAPMVRLVPWMAPYVKPGGRAVAYKGADVTDEMREAADVFTRCPLELEGAVAATLPGSAIIRNLVTLRRPAASAGAATRTKR